MPKRMQAWPESDKISTILIKRGARWGEVEWIEHPHLMLKVRGSNPGHRNSKNTTSLPDTKCRVLAYRVIISSSVLAQAMTGQE